MHGCARKFGKDGRKYGEEDCSRFSRDFDDWLNLSEQERRDVSLG